MVADSWFRSLWRTKKKHEDGPEKAVIRVLAFEVASLMSKLVQLWQFLSDKQVARLREEISNSVGIRKLVSDDDDYIGGLICIELFENMVRVAKSVDRLGRNCTDPSLKGFETAISDLINYGVDTYGWQLSWKKMERKAKKMERFISINANLYEEMEVLSELEQTLSRMKGSGDLDGVNLPEFQKKVVWKRQEVKNLKEVSLWNRTYDYTVLLLARSLFTIFGRIKHVFVSQSLPSARRSGGSAGDVSHVNPWVELAAPQTQARKMSLCCLFSSPQSRKARKWLGKLSPVEDRFCLWPVTTSSFPPFAQSKCNRCTCSYTHVGKRYT